MSIRSNRSSSTTTPSAATGWHDEQVMLDGVGLKTLRRYPAIGSDAIDDADAAGPTPLVLHFHGGAFVAGSLDCGAAVAQVLAEAGAAVASLDYPLAPAYPFPAAIEAGYAALLWLDAARKKSRRGGSAARAPLFVAGEEAGGNLAAAVAMLARDRGGPALAGQILLSPMLDACIATASQRDAREGPVGCECTDGWRAYLAQAADVEHPYAVPANAMRLSGLPATLLITSQDDPLRDEARAYALRLREAGVDAVASVLPAETGWPRSYQRQTPSHWTEPLREHLRSFIRPFARSFSGAAQPSFLPVT